MVDRGARGVAVLLGALAACASAPAPQKVVERSSRDYAPLTIGARWTYDMSYPGQTGEMSVTLTGVRDGYVVDDKNGAFRHTDEGLRDRDRYLIKHPLIAGTAWKSVVSASAVERSEILSVGEPCASVAGSFSDCVVVQGSLKRDEKLTLHIRWTWARDIGLVKVETEVDVSGKGRIPQTKQSLKHYALHPSAPPEPGKAPKELAKPAPDEAPPAWGKE